MPPDNSTFRARIESLVDKSLSAILEALRSATLDEVHSALTSTQSPETTLRLLRAPENRAGGHHARSRVPHAERRQLTLERAREWQRQLDAGEVVSRAAIARREGLSRARVTQILNMLRG